MYPKITQIKESNDKELRGREARDDNPRERKRGESIKQPSFKSNSNFLLDDKDKGSSATGKKKKKAKAQMQKGKKCMSDQKNRSPSAGIKRFTRGEVLTRDSKKQVKNTILENVKEKKPKKANKKKK